MEGDAHLEASAARLLPALAALGPALAAAVADRDFAWCNTCAHLVASVGEALAAVIARGMHAHPAAVVPFLELVLQAGLHPNLRVAEVPLAFWEEVVLHVGRPKNPAWREVMARLARTLVAQMRMAPETADEWDVGDEYGNAFIFFLVEWGLWTWAHRRVLPPPAGYRT